VKAVLLSGFGGVEVLRIGERPDPVFGDDELLVRVRATALNRADLLQRRGKYPPPEGASDILGLEMAGEVIRTGPAAGDFREGDRVCALLPGGGYAQRVTIPKELAIRLPDRFSYEEGAAIQLIREAGAVTLVTAGSHEKIRRCLELGAAAGWNYKEGPFAPWVAAQTGGGGVDLILDCVGAPYFEQNLQSLAEGGKLIVIGMMGGAVAGNLNLALLLTRRLQIQGSRLRGLSVESKAALTKRFTDFAMPRFEDGRLFPVIDSVYDWREVARAHVRMEENANIGKIVLLVSE
jgi:NADPH:quinone reductase-like Zn-dependent oxidoreductase